MATNPFSVSPSELKALEKTYRGRTTKPTDPKTLKVDAKPRPKPQPKLNVVPMPSVGSTVKSIANMVQSAPGGVADLAVSIPSAAYDYVRRSSPSKVASDVTSGLSRFADYVRSNPLEALVEMSPAGAAKDAGEMLREASLARDAGDEARAAQIEKFAVPMMLASVVPVGRAAKGAERSGLAAIERAWTEKGIGHALTERDGTITLNKIVVPKDERGSGKGTAAMKQLLAYADNTGQRVVLTPSSDFGGNKKRLTDFYKKFGFAENKGKKRDFSVRETMVREPDAPKPSSALRVATADEGDWELPADFGEDVPITTAGPAIITRPKPIETWHGTPNVFAAERKVVTPEGMEQFVVGKPDVLPDVPADFKVLKDYPLGRFRSEKLGSGEGAQQYGIGTYVAENPEVARIYRNELTADDAPPSIAGVPLEEFYTQLQRRADATDPNRAEALYDRLSALEDLGLHGDIRGVLDRAKEGAYLPGTTEWFRQEIMPKYSAPGALYQVDLGADPREFLDYDAPLFKQSGAIREAAANLDLSHLKEGNRGRVMVERFLANNEQDGYPLTGALFMSALPRTPEGHHSLEASEFLKKYGIPGIRYWDEGSRETRKGTSNYVVFDPERDLTIKDRFAVGGSV